MRRTTVYETDDGTLHRTEAEARGHEARQRMRRILDAASILSGVEVGYRKKIADWLADTGFTPPPFVPGMKWWCCTYERDGDAYGINIPAADAGEAERLLHDQFGNGTVDGEWMGSVRDDRE